MGVRFFSTEQNNVIFEPLFLPFGRETTDMYAPWGYPISQIISIPLLFEGSKNEICFSPTLVPPGGIIPMTDPKMNQICISFTKKV